MGLIDGDFGNAFYCQTSLVDGDFWALTGDETALVYRDDGAGAAIDYTMPVGWFEEGDSTDSITLQDLDATFSDSNTKLLLHFAGADAATETVDSSLSGHTITEANFELDDAQYKFGPTSGKFTHTPNGHASPPDHADWGLGSLFTIDCWVRFDDVPIGPGEFYFWRQLVDSTHFVVFQYGRINDKLKFSFDNAFGGGAVIAESDSAISLTAGAWHHFAVTRDGSDDIRLFYNGTVTNTTNDATAIPDIAAAPNILNSGSGTIIWVDEFRVVKGECKWDAAFDVPTQAHGYDDIKTWVYICRQISAAGSIGAASNDLVVQVDASGQWHPHIGNYPTDVEATPIADGKLRITWNYNEVNQPATPTGFKIYKETGGGGFTLDGSTVYKAGRHRYSYTTGVLAESSWDIEVRTYRTVSSIDYELDGDSATDTATADATGPAEITTVTVAEA